MTSDEIDRQAADWFALLTSGSSTQEDRATFEAWLASDVRALGAYCRVEGAISRLERVGDVARENLRGLQSVGDSRWSRRRIVLTGSAAASIAAAGLVGVGLLHRPGRTHFATRLGEVREFAMADGSLITLNTASEVSVKYTDQVRRIDLVCGEALFDVAKNKKRPFVVHAGGTEIRAVGTSFSVSVLPKRPIQVLVKEGVVELKRDGKDQALPVRVSANMRALASSNDRIVAAVLPQAKVTRDLAWQYGQVAFDNQALGDAAKEFARYNDIRIVVESGVAGRTITGLFASNDPVGFARMSAAALGLHVEVSDKEVKIMDRPEEKPVGVN